MGKGGGSSCFKIMTCGKDPEVNGEGKMPEAKIQTDKRKWSFRRRSSKNQVLSNISISGPLSVESNGRGSPEACSNNLNEPGNFSQGPEKSPSCKAVGSLSVVLDSSATDNTVVSNENKKDDASYQGSGVIVIQSAARRCLAYKELIKLKSVVKLQAVTHGYLVRRQAVGTLRCVRAIVKLQALIRARARSNLEGKVGRGYNLKKAKFSTVKLQANAFTRQLLASTPTKRPIYISCDPLKSASAWEWLERWMTLASPDVGQPHELEQNAEFEHHREKEDKFAISEASVEEAEHHMTSELQDLIPALAEEVHEPAAKEVSSPSLNNIEWEDVLNSTSSQVTVKVDANVHNEVHSEKQVVDIEKSKRTTKRMSIEPPESESNKTAAMPKRSCNPAFAAVQSKFEGLSAAPTSGRSFSAKSASSNQVIVTESKTDSLPHLVEKPDSFSNQINKSDSFSCEVALPTKPESNFNETSLSHQMQLQTASSECGTEISISSTLDSPDRSEAEGGEIVLEIGTLEGRHLNGNNISSGTNILDHTGSQTNGSSISPGTVERGLINANSDSSDLCNHEDSKSEHKDISATPEDFQVPKKEPSDGISGDSPSSDPMLEKPPSSEHSELNMHVQHENATGEQGDMLSHSPEASPRSHITAPESHGTPASQVSGVARSSKTETNVPAKKLKPQVAGKRSSCNANSSGGRDSAEHLQKDSQKDSKSGKRRNSLGMVKPDFLDHEPRNSSSNSLPNYMQATESAKARIHASNSPKSSPDIHDKESYTKKRHSLPIGNGKQGASPRMQRLASQVQQSSKENSKRSPNVASERKWQR